MATDQKLQKSSKGNVNCNNIDIQAMLLWLIFPFCDFFLRCMGYNT